MNEYAIINILGLTIAILMSIFSFFSVKQKLKPKIGRVVWTVFGIVAIAYGIYILSVKEILRKVFPQNYYSIGGWIAISVGIILLLTVLWGLKKDKKYKNVKN